MIIVDTNVLVYAVGSEHPLRAPARSVLGAATEGLSVRTTIEVVQEFAYVHARRGRDRKLTAKRAKGFAELLSPLVTLESTDLDDGLVLWQRHARLGPFDAVLAAAACRLGATLVTADAALAELSKLRVIQLTDGDLVAKLRSAGA